MPQLVALHDDKDDWDVFVVEGLERGVLKPTRNTVDVLGTRLPDWAGARIIRGIKLSESQRLARELRGLSKDRRKAFFAEQASLGSLTYSGNQA